MAKEYHATFCCDTEQDGGKSNINKIQRIMRGAGAELVSKNTEWEGTTELMFHFIGDYGDFKKTTQAAIDEVLNVAAHVSVNGCEHRPKVVFNTENLGGNDSLKEALSDVLKNYPNSSISLDDNKSNTIILDFNTSKDSREFQAESVATLVNKCGISTDKIQINPEWEDVTVIDANNRPASKKLTWTF